MDEGECFVDIAWTVFYYVSSIVIPLVHVNVNERMNEYTRRRPNFFMCECVGEGGLGGWQ